MALKYRHKEVSVLTAAQRTKFITFVTDVWPGATADIRSVTVTKERNDSGYELHCTVDGTMTVTDAGDLPDPPYRLTGHGTDYTYRHRVRVSLTSGQQTNFVDFVQDTWTGAAADVESVSFSRGSGTDIKATFDGTKSVATVGDLPDGAVTVIEET